MNYLAHTWLAGNDPLLLIGNISGDFVHGTLPAGLDSRVAEGLRMHRAIDAFTDSHPEVARCRRILWTPWRHATRVLVDLFFDAILYERWSEITDESFAAFSSRTYAVIRENLPFAPASAAPVLARMVDHDYLSHSSPADLEATIRRLSRRITILADADDAAVDFDWHREALEAAFSLFFPELVAFCAERGGVSSQLQRRATE